MTDPSNVPSTVKLTYGEKTLELPVIVGSEHECAVDIKSLRSELGLVTLDPGFGNTASCRSAITFIDGEKGILRYRGYPIEELAGQRSFLDVAYLLLNGELPDAAESQRFSEDVTRHTMPHEDFKRFFSALPKQAHPMPSLAAAVGALATFYPEPETREDVVKMTIRLIAKMPTLAAWSYKHSVGQPFMYPRNSLDYSANFLQMMFSTPCEDDAIDPTLAAAIDLLLVLHADHEQNCSTSTVRLVGSSRAGLFASISAGISALWGPLHGGANQGVIEMLENISHEHGSVDSFVERAKDKDSQVRLMGFGHRVYKNHDPRARILKQTCSDVLSRLGTSTELLDIAMRLEEIALSDDYFVSRNLYPNVDFYSGVIYKALGIPTNMFTVLFAMGRLPGWIAHWLEMNQDPDNRIGRPRQIYTGSTKRSLPS